MPVQQHMEQAVLADLRPTQMTVGAAEVAVKRSQWAQLKPRRATSFCKATGFPPCAARTLLYRRSSPSGPGADP